jgi:RNA polymerase sigma factor (sigma-70 family)
MQDIIRHDEKQLLALMSNDSEFAFQVIFDRYRDKVYSVAIRALKSPLLAQEIVQDVFIKVWLERKELMDVRSLEGWIFIVSRNHIYNQLRTIARDWKIQSSRLEISESFETPSEDHLDKKTYINIHRNALQQLSPQQREAYHLTRIQKFSHGEAAAMMGISPLTLKKHLSRALNSIRNYLRSVSFKLFSFF